MTAAVATQDEFAWWSALVGETVAARAKACRLEDGVLLLRCANDLWRTQLRLVTPALLKRIAAADGTPEVRQIRLALDARWILVTGTPTLFGRELVEQALLEAWHDATQDDGRRIEVVTTGQDGPETWAAQWAKNNGIYATRRTVAWAFCSPDCPTGTGHRRARQRDWIEYCPDAARRRDARLVADRPDLALAFYPDGCNPYTAQLALDVRQAGTPTRWFDPAAPRTDDVALERGIRSSRRYRMISRPGAERPAAEGQECLGEGCPACARGRDGLDRFFDDVDERCRRYGQPELYPFAAGRHTLHRTPCSSIVHAMRGAGTGSAHDRPVGSRYEFCLQTYSHLPEQNRDDNFATRYPYPALLAMTREEALSWVKEHTGPKGRKNYKFCRVCVPEL
ncbi:DUF721 domain-containing protein [Kitasatospora sp. HPMI-4]|uniref:DUF721 domain-containing protein n=1 Tax=Kitasatospora sp. HPMI-4 TaxID=3448443 RepID=UPI003F1C28B0